MTKKELPKVFIVILTHNGIDFISKCLKSIFNLDYLNFSVVLVDNNSKDGTLEFAKNNFSKAFFLRNNKNLGFAAGMNIGIRFSLERMADYVVVLNQDTEVEENFLSKIIEVGEAGKNIGILSPVIFNESNGKIWFSGGKIDWFKMKVMHFKNSFTGLFRESSFITGCSMVVKKEVFKKIGLFDEDFFLYYEDADFSLRSLKSGFKNVVVSNSWVYHKELSEKEGNKQNKLYWLVLSGLLFFRKHTSFPKNIWIKFFVFLRRIKNLKNIITRKDLTKADIIKKAFKDFKNVS